MNHTTNLFASMTWQQTWELIGWTMCYFLAIGTVVAFTGALIRFACRLTSPQIRYTVSLAVFASLALLPIGIAIKLFPSLPASTESIASVAVTESIPQAPQVIDLKHQPLANVLPPRTTSTTPLPTAIAQVPPTSESTSANVTIEHAITMLPWVWIVGAPLTFALLTTGLIGSERLRRHSKQLVEGPVFEACQRLRGSLQISRHVSIAVCERIASPLLVGVVRPLILLPPAALTGWTPEELEMVLLHELAHVRRWDNLVNFAQRIVESLLFFHPCVWWVSRWVRTDREECCDAVVVSQTDQPQAYAELLVALATPTSPLAGLAMAQHPLAGRIRRILHLEEEKMLVSRSTITLAGSALAGLLVALLWTPVGLTGAEEKQAAVVEKEAITAEAAAENRPDVIINAETSDSTIHDILARFKKQGSEFNIQKNSDGTITVDCTKPKKHSFKGLTAKAAIVSYYKENGNQHFKDFIGITKSTTWGAGDKKPATLPFVVSIPEHLQDDSNYRPWMSRLEEQGLKSKIHVADSEDGKYVKHELLVTVPAGSNPRVVWEEHAERIYPRVILRKSPNAVNGKYVEASRHEPQESTRKVKQPINAEVVFAISPTVFASPAEQKIWQKTQVALMKSSHLLKRAVKRMDEQYAQNADSYTIAPPHVSWFQDNLNIRFIHGAFILGLEEKNNRSAGSLRNYLRVIGETYLKEYKKNQLAVREGKQSNSDQSPSGFFPSLEDQQAADVAYKLLGIELEELGEDELARVKAMKFTGGLRVSKGIRKSNNSTPLIAFGDLLVGLHVWPTTSLADVQKILKREDIRELSPLKFYVIRKVPDSVNPGPYAGSSPDEIDKIVTGRISVNFDANPSNRVQNHVNISKATPLSPHKLAVGDLVKVVVDGTFPDQPIHDVYPIESMGTVALGPTYGRVQVVGLTLQEAEDKVKVKLGEILKKVNVQITLAKKSKNTSALYPGVPQPIDRYPGAPQPMYLPAVSRPPQPTVTNPPYTPVPALGNRAKPTLMFFHDLTNSAPSKAMMPIVRQITKQMSGQIDVGYVDVNQSPELASNYQVTKVPTLLLFQYGKKIGTYPGGPNVEELKSFINSKVIHPPVPTGPPRYNVPPPTRSDPSPSAPSKKTLNENRPAAPPWPTAIRPNNSDFTVPQPRINSSQPPQRSILPEQPTLLYDNKTFDEWRSLWKNELKTERRAEAIKALAAFGRAGYDKEAVEAILDVAGEYDFRQWDTNTAEGRLKSRIVDTLTHWKKQQLPSQTWLPILLARYQSNPEKYRWLTTTTISQLGYRIDNRTLDELIKLSRGNNKPLRDAAIAALSTQTHSPKALALARELIATNDPEQAMLVLPIVAHAVVILDDGGGITRTQIHSLPTFQAALRHPHLEVRQAARDLLRHTIDPVVARKLVDQNVKYLGAKANNASKIIAIRTLAALGAHSITAAADLANYLEEKQPDTLRHAAAFAMIRQSESNNSAFKKANETIRKNGISFSDSDYTAEANQVFPSNGDKSGGGLGGRGGGGGGFF